MADNNPQITPLTDQQKSDLKEGFANLIDAGETPEYAARCLGIQTGSRHLPKIHWSKKRVLKELPKLLMQPNNDYDIVVRALDTDGRTFAEMPLTLAEVHATIFPQEESQ